MCSRDVWAGLAELAGGCEGSSPPRKGGHSITRDEARLELDTVGRTNCSWHDQTCLSAGLMSVPPRGSMMKSDASLTVLPPCTHVDAKHNGASTSSPDDRRHTSYFNYTGACIIAYILV